MKITKAWLDSHRTPKGGWTRVQLSAIGVPWPPPKDWTVGVQGAEIDDETRAVFESNMPAPYRAIAPKPTVYRDIQFRSRLEARWAAFFDRLGWPYEYEPFDCDGWIPDFLLKVHTPVLVEVKPVATVRELEDYTAKIDASTARYEVLLVGATPFLDEKDRLGAIGLIREIWHSDNDANTYAWSEAQHFSCCGLLKGHEFGFSSGEGSYHCRVCGVNDGGGHRDTVGQFVQAKWSLAMNDTQWRPPVRS